MFVHLHGNESYFVVTKGKTESFWWFHGIHQAISRNHGNEYLCRHNYINIWLNKFFRNIRSCIRQKSFSCARKLESIFLIYKSYFEVHANLSYVTLKKTVGHISLSVQFLMKFHRIYHRKYHWKFLMKCLTWFQIDLYPNLIVANELEFDYRHLITIN